MISDMNGVKPYEGELPYIFVSYAHANAAAVAEVLEELNRQGYRLWYDDGIKPGAEWQEYIAEHLEQASMLLAFVSRAYMESSNCRKEMLFAVGKGIPTVNIFLEDTKLTPGLELQIGSAFALMKFSMNEDRFYEKLLSAPQLDESLRTDGPIREKRKKPLWRRAPVDLNEAAQKKLKKKKLPRIAVLVLLIVFLAGNTALYVRHFSGNGRRLTLMFDQVKVETLPGDTVAELHSPILEEAARSYSGKKTGDLTVADLAGITEIYLSGNRWSFTPIFPEGEESSVVDDVLSIYNSISGDDLDLDVLWETAQNYLPENMDTDAWLASLFTEEPGTFTQLSDLRYFTGLRVLSLQNQKLSSLTELPPMALEVLDISGCRVSSLRGIGNLPKLRELITDGCPISDLGNLDHCLRLRRTSLLGAHLSDFSAFLPLTELVELGVSDAAIDALADVLSLSKLSDLSFYNCDLRGAFFSEVPAAGRITSLKLEGCRLDTTEGLSRWRSLTELTLINSGRTLDWSALQEMKVLKTVTTDEELEPALRKALDGSEAELNIR